MYAHTHALGWYLIVTHSLTHSLYHDKSIHSPSLTQQHMMHYSVHYTTTPLHPTTVLSKYAKYILIIMFYLYTWVAICTCTCKALHRPTHQRCVCTQYPPTHPLTHHVPDSILISCYISLYCSTGLSSTQYHSPSAQRTSHTAHVE
jgi:hypothetical protein